MMAWVKIDDQFADHPKIIAVGPLAAWLYVCGLTYCGRYLTDGWIPQGQVRKLADVDNATKLTEKLVEAGLWEVVDGGYLVHDYLEYNPTASKVKATRKARTEAGRKGGYKSGESKRKAKDVANAIANKKQKRTPSPSPSPSPVPVPKNNGAKSAPSLSHFQELKAYWIELFPDKPKPRATNSSAPGRVATRMKSPHFVKNWRAAMLRASKSNYIGLKETTWFDFLWFVKTPDNYESCLNGRYDFKPGTKRTESPQTAKVVIPAQQPEDMFGGGR